MTRSSVWRLLLKAVLMMGGTAAISLAFWEPLQQQERAHVQKVTGLSTRSVQADIAADLEWRILAPMRLAGFLGPEQWLSQRGQDQARLFVLNNTGYIALQWLDPDSRVRWLVTAPEAEPYRDLFRASDAPLRTALAEQSQRRSADPILGPGIRLWDGRTGRRVIVPIYRLQALSGFIVAVFDVEKTFQSILADHAELGYSIIVSEGNEEVYKLRGNSPENELEWHRDAELHLPGAAWRIRVWPKRELLSEIESHLPEEALVTGSLIGLLLLLALDGWRAARGRSQELRRAHAELELRVQQRTAELRSANETLEAEIVERRRAEGSLQELSGRLLQLRDEERRRIARELHDSTAQLLGALAIDLEKLQQLVPNGDSVKARRLLTQSTELVEQATTEVRTISHLLHPPILDDLGLEAVLPWYAAGFSSRSGIQVEVDVQPDLGRFPHEVELTLFRIVQEALTNIHKHSGSSTARITVSRDEAAVMLQVADKGCGIAPGTLDSPTKGGAILGVGLAGMRERVRQLGGRLGITSGPQGTTVQAILPAANREDPFHLRLDGCQPSPTSSNSVVSIAARRG